MKQLVVAIAVSIITLLTEHSAGEFRDVSQDAAKTPEYSDLLPLDRVDTKPSTYTVNLNSIYRVQCGNHLGTAEVIDGNTLITASHVVGGEKTCWHNKQPVKVVYDNRAWDFAVLSFPTEGRQRFPYSCDGFVDGKTYLIVGWAEGTDFAVSRVVATSRYINTSDSKSGQPFVHVRVLKGGVWGGMSGGPVVGLDGVQVGTIVAGPRNSHDWAYARELKDTYLCAKTQTPVTPTDK